MNGFGARVRIHQRLGVSQSSFVDVCSLKYFLRPWATKWNFLGGENMPEILVRYVKVTNYEPPLSEESMPELAKVFIDIMKKQRIYCLFVISRFWWLHCCMSAAPPAPSQSH